MPSITIDVIKIFFLSVIASGFAVALTPALTNFLYRRKLWRKNARKKAIDGNGAEVFHNLHQEKETTRPRFGGLLIWGTTLLITLIFYIFSRVFSDVFWFRKLNFLSRSQTWLPIFAMVAGAILGLIDDILQVRGRGKYVAGGLSFWQRFIVVTLIGLAGGWWFYFKLDFQTLHIPGNGDIQLGPFYILFFIIVTLATWSGGVIDGIDGLAGGSFVSMFFAYGIIALARNQINLAAFCGVITGTILSFLWFNIPPARFYMGETGSLALTSALAVVAFLTDSVLVLPIIAGLLVIEAASVILQLLWKRVFKKKLFLSAPIHHHLEASGWPTCKITMRLWIIGVVFAIIGVAISLLG